MKKNFNIEMEEECLTCPNLSLVTRREYLYDGGPINGVRTVYTIHECEHIGFCKEVRNNWEKYHRKEEA